MARPSRTEQLRGLGFDHASYNRSTGYYHAKCSQCAAAVINGIPTHERGCPNTPRHTDDDE